MTVPSPFAAALLCALAATSPADREVPADALPEPGADALFGEPPAVEPPQPRGPSSDDADGLKLGSPSATALTPAGPRRPIQLRVSAEVERAGLELSKGQHEAASRRLRSYLDALPGASDETLARTLLDKAERLRNEEVRRLARLEEELRRERLVAQEERLLARRLELMTGATLYSAWLGVGAQVIFEIDQLPGLPPLFGAALGLLGSGIATEGVALEQGDAALFSASIVFGTLNGFGLGAIADSDTPQDWFANATLVGSLAVGGAALAIGPAGLHPDAGRVGFATTLGTWSAFAAGMGALAFDPDLGSDGRIVLLALSADAGLVAGVLLSEELVRITRYQAVVLDGAGIAGVGTAGLFYLIAGSAMNERGSDAGLAAVLTAGAVGGLGIGWIAVVADEVEQEPALVHLAPALLPGTEGPGFGLSLTLAPR